MGVKDSRGFIFGRQKSFFGTKIILFEAKIENDESFFPRGLDNETQKLLRRRAEKFCLEKILSSSGIRKVSQNFNLQVHEYLLLRLSFIAFVSPSFLSSRSAPKPYIAKLTRYFPLRYLLMRTFLPALNPLKRRILRWIPLRADSILAAQTANKLMSEVMPFT